jgi:hypothetical protein
LPWSEKRIFRQDEPDRPNEREAEGIVNRRKVLGLVAATVAVVSVLSSCHIVRLGNRALWGGGGEELPVSLAQARVRVACNLTRGTVKITRVHNPIEARDMVVLATVAGRTYSSADRACRNRVLKRDALRMIVRSAVENGPAWETRFEIGLHPNGSDAAINRLLSESYGVTITCRPIGDGATTPSAQFALDRAAAIGPKDIAFGRLTSTTSPAGIAPVALEAAGAVREAALFTPGDQAALILRGDRLAFGPIERGRFRARIPFRIDFDGQASLYFVEKIAPPGSEREKRP